MPTSTIKTKLGNKLEVKFRVIGSLDDLTTEDLKALALRYIRTSARGIVVAELNSAEPAVVSNRQMVNAMCKFMNQPTEVGAAFAKENNMLLEVPSTFDIPLGDLIPDSEGGRGKKAADIFSYEGSEDDEETEAEADSTTPNS